MTDFIYNFSNGYTIIRLLITVSIIIMNNIWYEKQHQYNIMAQIFESMSTLII